MTIRLPFFLTGMLLLALGSNEAAGQGSQLVLHVLRLKPGEAKELEFALPGRGEFRPAGKHGRDGIGIALLTTATPGSKVEAGKLERLRDFKQVPGLKLTWEEARPALSFHAATDVQPGTYDLRIAYESFGSGSHLVDVRVIVAKEVAMTPMEAVEAFRRNPDQRVTVEFGIASAGWLDGPKSIDEDPTPPLLADWDGRLPNGGKFSVYVTGAAIHGLKDIGIELPSTLPGLVDSSRLSLISKHLHGKGVRVTGLVKANRPQERRTDYTIVVNDPADFQVNK